MGGVKYGIIVAFMFVYVAQNQKFSWKSAAIVVIIYVLILQVDAKHADKFVNSDACSLRARHQSPTQRGRAQCRREQNRMKETAVKRWRIIQCKNMQTFYFAV